MSDWTSIITISRLVRSLLKDRLRSDGRDSYIYQGDINFTLSEDFPDSTSVKVFKNGTQLMSGFSYNSTTNIVTITAGLTTSDIILITYDYFDKYSEAEIVDYIEASFAYFAQFGYRKLFKLNDARDTVLTINGVNPSARECYEISIITSICIDPENIDIKTKDFSVTGTNNKYSKIELIQDALMKFTIWYGEMTYEDLQSHYYRYYNNSYDNNCY